MSPDAGPGAGVVAEPPGNAVGMGASLPKDLNSLEDLARWRDEVISLHRQLVRNVSAWTGVVGGAGNDHDSRAARPFMTATMEVLAIGIERMRQNGELSIDADPARLATGVAAALQGGSLLARTYQDIGPLEAALDVALSCVHAHSAR